MYNCILGGQIRTKTSPRGGYCQSLFTFQHHFCSFLGTRQYHRGWKTRDYISKTVCQYIYKDLPTRGICIMWGVVDKGKLLQLQQWYSSKWALTYGRIKVLPEASTSSSYGLHIFMPQAAGITGGNSQFDFLNFNECVYNLYASSSFNSFISISFTI